MSSTDKQPAAADWLRISIDDPVPDVCVVRVAGDIDVVTAPALRENILAVFGAETVRAVGVRGGPTVAIGPHVLIVDLADVEFLGSSGLAVLLRVRERAERAGCSLQLAGLLNHCVLRPLVAARLRPLFDIHLTLTDALNTCRAASAGPPLRPADGATTTR